MKTLVEGSLAAATQAARTHAGEVDGNSRFPIEAIRELKKAQMLGAMVPRSLGGQGMSITELASVCHTLGTACASTAMVFAMHQSQVACLLTHGQTEPWCRALLQRVAEEQLLIASVTSEVGTGGNIRNSICAVERDGTGFRLVKPATAISYGSHADLLTITARRAEDAAPSDQVLVAALTGDYVLEKTTKWDALGMRGTCTDGFVVRVAGDAQQILPVPYAVILETMLPASHLLWCAVWLGIATDAVHRARASLRADARRRQGEATGGSARLANAFSKLLAMQAGLSSALQSQERCTAAGTPLNPAAMASLNMLKVTLSETAVDAAMEALAICGIAGYRNGGEYSVGRHLRDLLSAPLMIGNDRIRENTANLLLMQMPRIGQFDL